jgi:predicted DNA-binding protein
MKNKVSVLTLRIPSELKHRIERIADEQGVSINQLALYAFTKEIQEMETSSFFSEQYSGKSRRAIFKNFQAVMERVKTRKSTPEWDRL